MKNLIIVSGFLLSLSIFGSFSALAHNGDAGHEQKDKSCVCEMTSCEGKDCKNMKEKACDCKKEAETAVEKEEKGSCH